MAAPASTEVAAGTSMIIWRTASMAAADGSLPKANRMSDADRSPGRHRRSIGSTLARSALPAKTPAPAPRYPATNRGDTDVAAVAKNTSPAL